MRRRRAAARDIEIRAVADPARRAACEADPHLFLRTYLAAKFAKPFTVDQREMVNEILRCARYGEDQSIAAPRGDGKTSIAEGVVIYCLVYGKIKFIVIVGASGPMAQQVLENIQAEFEDNDLLAADFPEVCDPIRELEGANSRANMQTWRGKRTRMEWTGDKLVFPTVEGSAASGSVLSARGIDQAVRGIRHRNLRPQFALIDDADTRESAESPTQTKKRERTIEQDVGGLAGPGRRLGRVLLCTITNHICIAATYTDRLRKPSWNGRRYRLLATPPAREDLWETYVFKRQTEGPAAAKAYFVERREEMERGGVVSNPNRVEPGQLSPLQFVYDTIADKGWEAFQTEYQNDPPEEEKPDATGLTAAAIQTRVNGLRRGIVPLTATKLTCGIDIGDDEVHWSVAAWEPGARGYVIDYGIAVVERPQDKTDAGVEAAIRKTLHEWREETLGARPRIETAPLGIPPYVDEAGKVRPIDLVLVDSGDRTDAVYGFVKDLGQQIFRASKGFGSGHRQSPFKQPKPGSNNIVGEHCYASPQQNGVWLHGLESDHWKKWMFDRLETMPGGMGSLTLFGTLEDARQHARFAKHLKGERFDTEKRAWVRLTKFQHWLDTLYMSCAASSMVGIRLGPSIAPAPMAAKPASVPRDDDSNFFSPRPGRW